jgi:hypothetical protein
MRPLLAALAVTVAVALAAPARAEDGSSPSLPAADAAPPPLPAAEPREEPGSARRRAEAKPEQPTAEGRGEGHGATPPPSVPIDAALARARALRIAEDVGWLRLLHVRRGLLGARSEADGPTFFLARDGKSNPAAELEATLRALHAEAARAADPGPEPDRAVACLFPARRLWLMERLGLSEADLPARPCPGFETFRDRVAPLGVTLVFSSYYLNNPASSFGHTLLRLDRSEGARDSERAELLDYAIDYSATVTTPNAVLYAVKGLLGFFEGQFNHYAYYYKVRQYGDAESRDLWEYDLALTAEERALLVAHLWELGNTWFDYWYLDENCSYHVLTALEAAAPRLALTEHVGRFVVVPADTVKALVRNPGLVRELHYRPSVLTQFRARLAPLSPAGLDAVEALAADPDAPLPEALGPERALVLDAALDHLDLWKFKALVLGKDPKAARERQRLLERRAALGVPSAPLAIPPPTARAPHLGHGSLRLGLGGGASREDGPLALLDLRLALHDLGDPPEGYPEVAHLEFLPLRLRLAPREGKVQLDEGWLVRIVSLNDVTRFDTRPSWHVRAGAETIRDRGGDGVLAFSAAGGAGFSSLGLGGRLDLSASADVQLEAAPDLSGLRGSAFRAGLGPSALLRVRGGTRFTLLADARWRWLPEARPRETWSHGAALRLHHGHAWSLALEGRRAPAERSAGLTLFHYR